MLVCDSIYSGNSLNSIVCNSTISAVLIVGGVGMLAHIVMMVAGTTGLVVYNGVVTGLAMWFLIGGERHGIQDKC